MLNIRKLESDLSAGMEANSAMTFYGQESTVYKGLHRVGI